MTENEKKQIEEMAELICDNKCDNGICSTDGCICNYNCEYKYSAEALYNAGYRKQERGEWEIVKGSNGQEKMVCTNCRHGQDLHSTFTYCPNCGAKMKGGAQE